MKLPRPALSLYLLLILNVVQFLYFVFVVERHKIRVEIIFQQKDAVSPNKISTSPPTF